MLNKAYEWCKEYRHEFIMPEHLLLALLEEFNFNAAVNIFYSPYQLEDRIKKYLESVESLPEGTEYVPETSAQMGRVIELAVEQVYSSSAKAMDIPHLARGIFALEDSWAAYLLKDSLYGKEANFMSQLISFCDFDDELEEKGEQSGDKVAWKKLVTCMNDLYKQQNPLIGREQELQRTIQVLCRRDKNNPLHIGEPGVGKTALVWGLARMIEEGRVPKRLMGCKIYQLDMGTLLAGTQYRGDFENRIKMIMDGVAADQDYPTEPVANIVYIDEIHTLVGAGATSDSAMDASNMLKPYLEAGTIRFIGSTTYEEYNRYFSRSKGIVRRFQQIDIPEPSVGEAKHILRQLQPRYEEFHHVKYDDEAVNFAVEASAKYVNDRFLPDKAIDLIDEAGASFELRIENEELRVSKADIADVLAKTCKVDALAIAEEDDITKLSTLNAKLTAQIYGQDEAIRQVVEAVQMSRAGGLLTDAIRKSPNAVLLLDEIEKAHQDIYNILLQVMDYARLTDNKGRKADFRNVVLIMTSNAGAQFASAGIGFNSSVSRGEAMMKQVKKTFKPEFLNRLSGAVVFRDMDKQMATLILQKKLRELDAKLAAKQVKMTLTAEAFDHLLKEGFTAEYGAREMDRVIAQQLKPLLMREILFGSLKQGGEVTVNVKDGSLAIG